MHHAHLDTATTPSPQQKSLTLKPLTLSLQCIDELQNIFD